MVDLDAQRAAVVVDRHGQHQRAVLLAARLEAVAGLARPPAQLGVMALALQLGQHDQRQHDLVLVEAEHRLRIGQQHRRVDHVGLRRDGRGATENEHLGRGLPQGQGTRQPMH